MKLLFWNLCHPEKTEYIDMEILTCLVIHSCLCMNTYAALYKNSNYKGVPIQFIEADLIKYANMKNY